MEDKKLTNAYKKYLCMPLLLTLSQFLFSSCTEKKVELGKCIDGEIHQLKYQKSRVRQSLECESEIQFASCENDNTTGEYSGTYTHNECFKNCRALNHGEKTKVQLFRDKDVNKVEDCKSKVVEASCNNGVLTNNDDPQFAYAYCSELPHLKVSFSKKNLEKLEEVFKENHGKIYIPSSDHYVKAKIDYNGQILKAQIRPKGTYIDHHSSTRWSMRVKLKKSMTVLGKNKFSLQDIVTRGPYEIFHNAHMRELGITTNQYRYVNLTVNGIFRGTVAFEEHYDKRLLESQMIRETPIFAFDENYYYNQRILNTYYNVSKIFKNQNNHFNNFYYSPFKAFGENGIYKNDLQWKLRQDGISKLRDYKEGKIDSEKIVDMEKMAKFMAVHNTWGTPHGLIWNNLRFYFNPFTRLLEPISFDNDAPELGQVTFPSFYNLSSSSLFISLYKEHLQKIKTSLEQGELQKILQSDQNKYQNSTVGNKGDLLQIPSVNFDFLVKQNNYALKHLPQKTSNKHWHAFDPNHPERRIKNPEFSNFLLALYIKDEETNKAHLELVNTIDEPVQAFEFGIVEDGIKREIRNLKQTILNGQRSQERTKIKVEPLKSNKDYYYVKAGYGKKKVKTKEFRSIIYSDLSKESALTPLMESFTPKKLVTINAETRTIVIGPGTINIHSDFETPPNYTVSIKEGTILEFNNAVRMTINGKLLAQGKIDKKIHFKGSNSSEKWGGILLSGKKSENSILQFVDFNDIRFPLINGNGISGCTTVYNTNIKIEDVNFQNMECEDALNLVSTQAEISKVSFKNIAFDAIDNDFGQINLTDSDFLNIGDDGVDLNNSEALIKNVTMKNIRDKGISVGEHSNTNISNISISDAKIGIANKDGSTTNISNSKFSGIRSSVYSGYLKKDEFRDIPCELIATNNQYGESKAIKKTDENCRVELK